MTVYQWKSGCRLKGDAQVAGEVCEQLELRGELTPSALVDASRSADAPLHGYFEWNDETAAEKYREVQAGHIIRSVTVKYADNAEPVRAFVALEVKESTGYVSTIKAVKSEATRGIVLKNALRELREFEHKYGHLAELADVIAAIREVA